MARIKENILNKDDLILEDIRGSGPGGQNKNKNFTGVRITHKESGAVGEATDSKSHEQNKRNAFRRMIATSDFVVWLELKLHPEYIKMEVIENGEWIVKH